MRFIRAVVTRAPPAHVRMPREPGQEPRREKGVPLEAYVPSEITLAGEPLAGVRVVTLYDPDSDTPHGAITMSDPPAEGERAGPLILQGTREHSTWRVEIAEIEVYQRSAVGCEFNAFATPQRRRLDEPDGRGPDPHA